MTVGENIARLRKAKGWTQAELGERLGVSNQAISKWEKGMTMPDIMLLPLLADIFGCHIDELFSREVKTEIHYDHCAEFPWADDETVRGVVCRGKKILQSAPVVDKFTFELIGDAKNVQSECNITVSGNVSGGCIAGANINAWGNVSGGCNCGDSVTVGGYLSGDCNTGGEIVCGGNFTGDVNCGGAITVRGDMKAEKIEGSVTVGGDIEATKIEGNVVCHALKCEKIEGNVALTTEK